MHCRTCGWNKQLNVSLSLLFQHLRSGYFLHYTIESAILDVCSCCASVSNDCVLVMIRRAVELVIHTDLFVPPVNKMSKRSISFSAAFLKGKSRNGHYYALTSHDRFSQIRITPIVRRTTRTKNR